MTDEHVWHYALAHAYTILTKDADFYYKCLTTQARPKIIHFRLGNTTLQELHNYFEQHWQDLVSQLEQATLILAESDRFTVLF